MSAPDSTITQINFKTPGGTLINLYGSTVQEAGELIDHFGTVVLPKVLATEQAILTGGTVAAVIPLAPAPQQYGSPTPPAPPALPAAPPTDWTVQAQAQQGPPPAWAAAPAALPPAAPVAAPQAAAGHLCDHGYQMKLIPPGVSKNTGKPYPGFYACPLDKAQQCGKRVTV